jgi:hypothetical protein
MDKALQFLEISLTLKPPHADEPSEILERRNVLGFLGEDSDVASIDSIKSPQGLASEKLMIDIMRSLNFAKPSIGVDVDRLSHVGVGLTEHFTMDQNNSLPLILAAIGTQNSFLSKIDPTLEFGNTGFTVSEQIQKNETLIKEWIVKIKSDNARYEQMTNREKATFIDKHILLSRTEQGSQKSAQ